MSRVGIKLGREIDTGARYVQGLGGELYGENMSVKAGKSRGGRVYYPVSALFSPSYAQ